ncbi:fumarylacetoacetate hydrolase family protein [Pseudomonas fuscovaginae UPB0736]|uniref:fumarylacetoacetate hydrolase family protein n=1 Tax=Pseudomonas asplenii TaxID=53407 RepID=UPI0002893B35|nr:MULTISPECIES: fumarylacetoacetate hydrolase family protein [Pseudomonas]UUQ64886.1 fumarylacetoacetate hydrolase family protein [Pseudomonas fuscovaginae UPB0736]UZE26635.1 fumarylacetoacetate hydrolase family protein [Pseudomonas asplenii]
MKIASFVYQNRSSYGVVEGEHVIDLESLKSHLGADLKEAIARNQLSELGADALKDLPRLALSEITFLPVIANPGKVLCIGINYATHMRETGRDTPTYPMIFTRFADSQTAHLQPIVRPIVSHKLDFEGELAVVIGKTARHVKAQDALDYVAGYACYNDGSVRDWQKHTIQFVPGKNFTSTGGFGPWMVTSDEIVDPQDLELTTRLNGEVMQHTRTSDMIFDVRRLIEYCTAFTELAPGDVIVSGTTGGVGAFREPPVWMKPGDIVEIEIERIGILRNSIVDER